MESTPQKLELITKYFSEFSPEQFHQLTALESLYTEWNAKINVISRKDIEGLYEKHVLHSLSIAAAFDFPAGTEIIDIGTGGGFPGIPLAIFFPHVKFHLVDSIGKKLKIVEAVKDALNLKNITTEHARAEDIKNKTFDFAVSRAVAPLKELWTWCRLLLKEKDIVVQGPEGITVIRPGLICLKGGDLSEEIKESGLHPHSIEVDHLFQEQYFKGKFLLYIPK